MVLYQPLLIGQQEKRSTTAHQHFRGLLTDGGAQAVVQVFSDRFLPTALNVFSTNVLPSFSGGVGGGVWNPGEVARESEWMSPTIPINLARCSEMISGNPPRTQLRLSFSGNRRCAFLRA